MNGPAHSELLRGADRAFGWARAGIGVGAHLGGFGDAEVGVDVQGVLPVLACLLQRTSGVAGVGEAAVGAGLLVPAAGLFRQG
jgi:hypothetical protein